MPSIRDVAREAGVSIATVSRVINGSSSVAPSLRQRVLDAVETCDYAPAVGRRSLHSIALVYAGPFSVGSPYDSACLEGMVDVMRETPFDLTILDLQRDKLRSESMQQFLTRKGARGAIVRSTANERALVAQWREESVPIVVLGDHFDCPDLSFVYAGSEVASRDAVEHLVSLGHTRIAFAACETDDGDHLDRLSAYQQVLDHHGLADETLICRVPPHRLDGAQMIRNLLGMSHRPTALFIADPWVAVGAINEAHALGVRIPDDLSIVGFDDTDIRSLLHPRMSAVCQDSKLLGRSAFERVVRLVENGSDDAALEPLNAWFEIGSTTGPPPEVAERVLPTGARLPSKG